MFICCATCGDQQTVGSLNLGVSQYWCNKCSQPKYYKFSAPDFSFPVKNYTSIDDIKHLLDSATSHASLRQLIQNALSVKLEKDVAGGWVCITNDTLLPIEWAHELISIHPVWNGILYNIAMTEFR
jgi:hypothetical protein